MNATRQTTSPPLAPPAPAGRSLAQDAWRRLRANRAAMVSLVLLALIVLACSVGPWWLDWDLDEVDWEAFRAPPSWVSGHWLGTDANGRDLLTRTLYGGQVSLTVAVVASAVALVVGVLYGAIAGFAGGRVDALMMRG